jgi:SAM-dependent methyltransferase
MRRSNETELAEAEDISAVELARNYRELEVVHRWLGDTAAILRLLREEKARKSGQVRVLDIGCGQGALLVEIRDKLGMDVVGFELRPAPADAPVLILTGNAVTDPLPRADAAVCMAVTHHLSESEVAGLIANVSRYCARFIVLDLVRNPVPLALFRVFLAPFLYRINAADGATSIRRAFTVTEMRQIVDGALAKSKRPVIRLRHTVAPLWTRQVVDITWGEPADD